MLRALTDYALVSFQSSFTIYTTAIIVITSIAKCEARIGHRIILDQLLDLSCTDVHSVAEVEFPTLLRRQFWISIEASNFLSSLPPSIIIFRLELFLPKNCANIQLTPQNFASWALWKWNTKSSFRSMIPGKCKSLSKEWPVVALSICTLPTQIMSSLISCYGNFTLGWDALMIMKVWLVRSCLSASLKSAHPPRHCSASFLLIRTTKVLSNAKPLWSMPVIWSRCWTERWTCWVPMPSSWRKFWKNVSQ